MRISDWSSDVCFRSELVTDAVAASYDVVLHVVMIPVELSGRRVAARVAAGGHDVPTEKLASRYERLWPLVVAAVPHCHRAVLYDNYADDGPTAVASYRSGLHDHTSTRTRWTPPQLLAL